MSWNDTIAEYCGRHPEVLDVAVFDQEANLYGVKNESFLVEDYDKIPTYFDDPMASLGGKALVADGLSYPYINSGVDTSVDGVQIDFLLLLCKSEPRAMYLYRTAQAVSVVVVQLKERTREACIRAGEIGIDWALGLARNGF